MDTKVAAILQSLFGYAATLKSTPVPEQDVPDVAGQVRAVERLLAEGIRQPMTKELDRGTHEGETYAVIVGDERVRNYNGIAILADIAAARDWSLMDALVFLMNEDAVRLGFRWQELERAMSKVGVDIRIQNRELGLDEIGDPDGPHVGQYWRSKAPRIVAIPPPPVTAP